MKLKYKYDPKDFDNYMFLGEEMRKFYNKYELYKNNPTKRTKYDLDDALHLLHFSIKHRAVEEYITDQQRDDMWEYFWRLADD